MVLIAVSELECLNPLINISLLQGRHDTYPKRRGLTRVPSQWPLRWRSLAQK